MNHVPDEALRLMRLGSTVTEATRAWLRSSLSSRSRVLHEANRRGLWFGIVSRHHEGGPIGPNEARSLAAASAKGNDIYDHCAVPDRWHRLFVHAFAKAAVHAAHTTRDVSVRSV